MRTAAAAATDVLVVLLFVVAGRRTHAAVDVAGTAQAAWPFLAALALGWGAARAWQDPTAVLRTGVPVWLVTLGGGMLLRRLAGDGTAVAFVGVAALTLAAGLLGWRAAARRWRHRQRSIASTRSSAQSASHS